MAMPWALSPANGHSGADGVARSGSYPALSRDPQHITSDPIASQGRAEQNGAEKNSACTASRAHPVAPNRSWNGPSLLRLGIAFPHPPHVSETARVQGSSYASIHMSRRDSVAIWLGQFNASAQRFNIDAETLK